MEGEDTTQDASTDTATDVQGDVSPLHTPSLNEPEYRSPSLNDPQHRSPSLNDPEHRTPTLNSPSLNDPQYRSPSLNDPQHRSPSLNDPQHRTPSLNDPQYRSASLIDAPGARSAVAGGTDPGDAKDDRKAGASLSSLRRAADTPAPRDDSGESEPGESAPRRLSGGRTRIRASVAHFSHLDALADARIHRMTVRLAQRVGRIGLR